MRKILIIVTLLLGVATFAKADEASHKELVEQLFTVMNTKEVYKDTSKEIVDMQIRSNPMLQPIRSVLLKFFDKYLSWESLKPELTKLYMDAFTENEMRDIVSFFSTPVGILWSEKSFELSMKSMELSQQQISKHSEELQTMIAEEMTKRAQTVKNAEEKTTTNPK